MYILKKKKKKKYTVQDKKEKKHVWMKLANELVDQSRGAECAC